LPAAGHTGPPWIGGSEWPRDPDGTTKEPIVSQVQLLELDVTADPSVLLRIVSLCHKRGIAIASLQYESLPLSAGGRPAGAAQDASGSLQLGLRGDADAAGQAARWLDAIVPVLAVRPQGAGGRSAADPGDRGGHVS
jgi:hypothetical protein